MKRLVSLGFSVALIGAPAYGQGVPVADATSLSQLIAQLKQQVEDFRVQSEQLLTLQQQLQEAQAQLVELRATVESITGPRGFSALLNGDLEQAARAALADNLNEALREAGAGRFGFFTDSGHFASNISPESIAGELLGAVLLDPARLDELSRSDSGVDRGTAMQAGAGVTLSMAAQDANARADGAVQTFEAFVEEIDRTPDIKGSMDLNTRVTAELGFMLANMIRLEATEAHALGAAAVIEARDREAASKFSAYRETEE